MFSLTGFLLNHDKILEILSVKKEIKIMTTEDKLSRKSNIEWRKYLKELQKNENIMLRRIYRNQRLERIDFLKMKYQNLAEVHLQLKKHLRKMVFMRSRLSETKQNHLMHIPRTKKNIELKNRLKVIFLVLKIKNILKNCILPNNFSFLNLFFHLYFAIKK